jgi:hypothetical protein
MREHPPGHAQTGLCIVWCRHQARLGTRELFLLGSKPGGPRLLGPRLVVPAQPCQEECAANANADAGRFEYLGLLKLRK